MTIKEVAQLAGVSTAAVSRYFNGGPLGRKKRQKIREVVEQTGYSPNVTAKTMRTGKSGQIGVILPRMQSESTARIMSGIEECIKKEHYIIILGCTDGDYDNEIRYLEAMQQNHVEGIILMGTVMTPRLKDVLLNMEIPVVVTGQNFEGIPCVYHDDYNAIRELTDLMLKKGRKNLLYIGAPEEDEAAGLARRKGFEAACLEAGLDKNSAKLTVGGFTAEEGRNVMERQLKEDGRIDGVVCASDTMALGAVIALRAAGKKLPEDISIAGLGDSWAGQVVEPQLTTARLYYHKCGNLAVKMLFDIIGEREKGTEQPIRQIMLGYSIIERGSI